MAEQTGALFLSMVFRTDDVGEPSKLSYVFYILAVLTFIAGIVRGIWF